MMKDKFYLYMTQGQGECRVGEFDSREAVEKALEEGLLRKDGSYRYTQLWGKDL